jgi:hypothetical protein
MAENGAFLSRIGESRKGHKELLNLKPSLLSRELSLARAL